jgi:hypothetical protein
MDDPAASGKIAAGSAKQSAISMISRRRRSRALLFERKSQWGSAIAEAETAIADDPNNARAIATAAFYRMFVGHAEDGIAGSRGNTPTAGTRQ